MNTAFKLMTHTALVGLGLIGSGLATAHDHGRWHGSDRYRPDHYYGPAYVYAPPRYVEQVYVERNYAPRYDAVRYAYARVIDVDPIVRRVAIDSPQQDCWYEDRDVYAPRSHTPTVLGAIIGGVVGHQFGQGRGRDVGTVAGALLGASVGSDVARRDAGVETRSVERCQVSARREWQERIDGYRVRYWYAGREYCADLPYDPGSRVQVRVGRDVEVVR